jgi:hypothetical protein
VAGGSVAYDELGAPPNHDHRAGGVESDFHES